MLIGIDVGTTAVKAAVFDRQGHVLQQFGQRYATARPAPLHVEQSPEDWMTLVMQALKQFETGQAISGLGLCSQVNTHVFLDAEGEALLPAFTWQDGRCADDAARLDAMVSIDDKIKWWGAPLPIDSSHVLARMAYVARVRPDVWAKTKWVLAPKDYCIFKLTGRVVTDPMTCFGIVDQDLQPIQNLIALLPSAAERLPPIAGFTEIVGRIKDGLPCAGAPVVTSAMDAWSGLLGAGVSNNGQGLYLSGTSEILGIVSGKKTPTRGVIAFAPCEGIVLHAGPTQSGGASVEWLCRMLGKTAPEISALAAEANLQDVPIFLPHLAGERAPLWDINARGSFAGLSSSTGAAEMARAVLEGVGYSARLVFESLYISAGGLRPSLIHHSGGGATSNLWCQIRADILSVSLKRCAMREAGVLGAALMAGVGVGNFTSLQQAADTFVKYDQNFEPDPQAAERHEKRFEQYQMLYRQLIPFNAALGR
jgi:xylulokinase